jgi:glycine oxidase
MNPSSDVLVIGGGAVGTATARALAVAGARVTLLQRPEAAGEGWRAAAGMLAAQIEAGTDDPLLNLALAGRAFYRRQAGALREATGIDIGLRLTGVLQIARSEADVAAFREKVAWQRQQAHRADWLAPEEVTQGWPWIAPGLGAFWSPEDGALDPQRTVEAFRTDAVRLGMRVVHDTAIGLDRRGDTLVGVIGAQDRYTAGHVVIAGGAWAGRLEHLPRPLSVEPVRGQMGAFPWPGEATEAVVYGPRCYLLRRGDEMLVGATMEHVGFDASTTADGLADLFARAATIYPALAGMTPTRTWAGLRPGTPDGLPIIGPEPRLRGLWYATGHGRNGILLAGITGELIAASIQGEPWSEEYIPLRASRFWNW